MQHNNSRGPFKGGFKYHPEASLDDVERWDRVLREMDRVLKELEQGLGKNGTWFMVLAQQA